LVLFIHQRGGRPGFRLRCKQTKNQGQAESEDVPCHVSPGGLHRKCWSPSHRRELGMQVRSLQEEVAIAWARQLLGLAFTTIRDGLPSLIRHSQPVDFLSQPNN